MNNLINKIITALICCCLFITGPFAYAFSDHYIIQSPDKNTQVTINISDTINQQSAIRYSVEYHGKALLKDAKAWISIENHGQGALNQYQLISHQRQHVDQIIYPVIKQKSAQIRDNYQQINFTFNQGLSLSFRVYDNGVAYRFASQQQTPFKVTNELAEFNFSNNARLLFPEENSFISHNERLYLEKTLNDVSSEQFASLPLLAIADGVNLVITETGLRNYPGMWLAGNSTQSLKAIFPPVVLASELKENSDRNEKITKRAHYIADFPSPAKTNFPWRIMALASDDKALLTNQLSYLLADDNQITDSSWIVPGKVAWDWWNANNIYGVDFQSGINTQTYKYYIDFAAQYGIEYILLDEGWYKLGNVLDISDNIDVQAIINYGKSKNVKVILWVIWETLEQQLALALDTYQAWGAAGIKVDFMQRDDQSMVQYYWQVAEQAAKRQLLVNFHGSYKPAGLRRAYPNVITREGLRGLEHNKWADYITSSHNLTLPFIRMLAGPMDYTPGAMVNKQPKNFSIVFDRPMSKTTRAHQVAMYVIYESPLQMLADSPSNYLKEAETTTFISHIPTVWDETKVLFAKIKDHIVTARRFNQQWFIGAMNNQHSKAFTLDLNFLDDKTYQIEIFKDGINANNYASDYTIEHKTVTRNDKITLSMAKNGGWAARLTPVLITK